MHQSIINFTNIQNSIKENQEKTNNKNNIKIIAVSKTFEISHINPLIDYGHTDFGENKVQEAIEKWSNIKIKNQNLSLHFQNSGWYFSMLFLCQHQDGLLTD